MRVSLKSLSLGAAILAAIATAANARADTSAQQIAQTAGAAPGVATLPEVVIRPRPQSAWYYDPYTSGHAQRPSSLNHIPFMHFKVPVGYDADVTMHPYTSGLGPCTEHHDLGCGPSRGYVIKPSQYERPPFNR